MHHASFFFFFFFNDTATTEIYTLSLHDALPICGASDLEQAREKLSGSMQCARPVDPPGLDGLGHRSGTDLCHLSRSEEHTSELQSPCNLVCRLLLEKKKNQVLFDIHRVRLRRTD